MDYAITPVLDKLACVLELPLGTNLSKLLLLETFSAESGLKHLRQTNGPALGLGQVEPATYEDVCNYTRRKGMAFLGKTLYCVYGDHYRDFPPPDYLCTDLRLQIVISRLIYWRVPQAIPETLDKRAAYWKTYYNTPLGRGTVQHYLDSVPTSFR
jgi:hypothetical protein